MNDIGPFQDIIAVGWGKEQFTPSDTGWLVDFTAEGGEFIGAPFSWTVRLVLPAISFLDDLDQDFNIRVYAQRDVVFDRPYFVAMACVFYDGAINGFRGSEDVATVSSNVTFYQESTSFEGEPQVAGDPNGSGTIPAGPFRAVLGLTSGNIIPTRDRPEPTTLDVTFTFTPI